MNWLSNLLKNPFGLFSTQRPTPTQQKKENLGFFDRIFGSSSRCPSRDSTGFLGKTHQLTAFDHKITPSEEKLEKIFKDKTILPNHDRIRLEAQRVPSSQKTSVFTKIGQWFNQTAQKNNDFSYGDTLVSLLSNHQMIQTNKNLSDLSYLFQKLENAEKTLTAQQANPQNKKISLNPINTKPEDCKNLKTTMLEDLKTENTIIESSKDPVPLKYLAKKINDADGIFLISSSGTDNQPSIIIEKINKTITLYRNNIAEDITKKNIASLFKDMQKYNITSITKSYTA